ncbi:hypothetical protein [Phaeovulum sp. NW3]|uniref:hypothetical protein n=1 Tax=Phaeovulum sp. NW3 TaxID=2934933 RepID=UPI0020213D1E|nr:hypothetical protein [Phaeovulum sp. NW3]MCL7465139.1 hypothetical protein [Phaeovulum sp. NW3]
MILALGNMRAALEWFAMAGPQETAGAAPATGARARPLLGLDRLDRQLEEVEDAAWRVLAALQQAGAEPSGTARAGALGGAVPGRSVTRDGVSDGGLCGGSAAAGAECAQHDPAPVFISRRAAGRRA